MVAYFRIINDASPTAWDQSILHDGDDAHVWLAGDADKTPATRPINVGRAAEGVDRPLDGLNPNDNVVLAAGGD